MNVRSDLLARLDRRSADLVALFVGIARTRMAGMPVSNPALQVEALGFKLDGTPPAGYGERPSGRVGPCLGRPGAAARVPVDQVDAPPCGLGVLITPWFMNLVRLPLQREDRPEAVGRARAHLLAGHVFEFIGSHEPAIGSFAACSLFSPMFEFADQAAARATAVAVLTMVRATPATPEPTMPARRSFLFGRSVVQDSRP